MQHSREILKTNLEARYVSFNPVIVVLLLQLQFSGPKIINLKRRPVSDLKHLSGLHCKFYDPVPWSNKVRSLITHPFRSTMSLFPICVCICMHVCAFACNIFELKDGLELIHPDILFLFVHLREGWSKCEDGETQVQGLNPNRKKMPLTVPTR